MAGAIHSLQSNDGDDNDDGRLDDNDNEDNGGNDEQTLHQLGR